MIVSALNSVRGCTGIHMFGGKREFATSEATIREDPLLFSVLAFCHDELSIFLVNAFFLDLLTYPHPRSGRSLRWEGDIPPSENGSLEIGVEIEIGMKSKKGYDLAMAFLEKFRYENFVT